MMTAMVNYKQSSMVSKNFTKNVIASMLCILLLGITYLSIARTLQISSSPVNPLGHDVGDGALVPGEEEDASSVDKDDADSYDELKLSLSKAANPNKTVLITSLSGGWAQNNSMIDLFLQSFHLGNGTKPLLKNLLIVAVDEKALNRCTEMHPHCHRMRTGGVDFSGAKVHMSQDYVKMMWRRLRFFGEVLEQGYNFVFSDLDIMWLRDPFTKFSINTDIQFAADKYRGEPEDLQNLPNAGFMYVQSNDKNIRFFRYWYRSRLLYPGKNEQDVLNILKLTEFKRRRLKVKFLDTKYFGGYCQRSEDLNSVCTMHANCCKKGLEAKLFDLRNTLSDWEKYKKQTQLGHGQDIRWTPSTCKHSRGWIF